MQILPILSAVTAATSTLLSATEIGKNLKEIVSRPEPDVAASKTLIIELLDKLLETKMAQVQIQGLVATLERELKERDQFEAELARYDLSLGRGRDATVYSLKADDNRGEPPHCICPGCASDRKKVILQPCTTMHNCLYCTRCKSEFLINRNEGSGISTSNSGITREGFNF